MNDHNEAFEHYIKCNYPRRAENFFKQALKNAYVDGWMAAVRELEAREEPDHAEHL